MLIIHLTPCDEDRLRKARIAHQHKCPTCELHFTCRCAMGREAIARCAECGAAANEAADLNYELTAPVADGAKR